jgi:chorismate mutase
VGGLAEEGDDINLYQVELLRQKAGEMASKAFRKGNNLDGRAFKEVEQGLRTSLSNNSQFFDDAIARYADEITEAKGLAGEANLSALVNASPQRLQQVSASMLKLPANRITALRNLFHKESGGKEAWNTVVRQNLQDRLENIQSAQPGAKRLVSLMGKPKQAREIKAMLKGNPEAEKIMEVLEYVATKPTAKAVTAPPSRVTRVGPLGEMIGAAKDKLFSAYDSRRDAALVELLTNPAAYGKEIARIRKLRAPKSTKRVLLQSFLAQIAARLRGQAADPGSASAATSGTAGAIGGNSGVE